MSIDQKEADSHTASDGVDEHKQVFDVSPGAEDIKHVRRKIDRHIIPFFVFTYTLNFVDKVLLNYAQVMGVTPALKLKGNDYSNASSAFYYSVLVLSISNTIFLQKLPVGKWLAFCLCGWAIVTTCHAAVTDYQGLVAVRVVAGLFEAGIPPSLMLLTSQYYTRGEQASRFAIWYAGIGFGQIIGGFVSWIFLHVPTHSPVASWRVMYIVLGLVSFVYSLALFFFIPSESTKAKFLSNSEKATLWAHIRANQTGIRDTHFKAKQIFEAVTSIPYWLIIIIVIMQTISSGVTSTYSALLIKSFGYTPKQSALLGMPSGLVSILSCVICGETARRFGCRWLVIAITSIFSVVGAALMSFMPHSQAGSLAGIYLINFIIGATPLCYQWITTNTAGHTQRAFVTGSLNAAFAVGSIIGPQTFQAKDAPGYQPAKITLIVCFLISAVLAGVTRLYYGWANGAKQRKFGHETENVDEVQASGEMSNHANTNFRYVY